ncbi:MAG TPA: 2-oxo acid dehydrogenase subunit E2 [Candidatus Binatia bacterium]|nr:2-oxo acid dehydrogenase subunit E2 [Candidatus Binatia bacterium]
MAREFRLPDPGEGIHEAEILDVYVSAGDEVQEGDIILYIETDKAAVEVPSPFTGVIEEIRVKKGDVVQVGDVLVTFTGARGEEAGRERKVSEERPKEEVAPQRGETATRRAATEKPELEGAEKRGKERPSAEEAPAKAQAQEKVARKEQQTEQVVERPIPASPATRRLARELGVALHEVQGSGPGGRVTAEDVRTFASKGKGKLKREEAEEAREKVTRERPGEAEAEAAEERRRPQRPLVVELPPLPDFSRWGPVEHVPLQGIRRATAKQMALAWSQIPHVTHQDIADITELEAFRHRHQAAVERHGGKLSLTVLVMQAVVAALKQFPRFNASVDPEAGEIILKQYYHLGIAVDTEHGLIVPVVRDVDSKSLTELAAELTELAERTRQGKARREEMLGGTFTITNPGPIGGTAVTPIINYPEVAILGLAGARLEPVVHGDLEHFTIVPRLRLPLHLAFDHRVNDGADAARFVRTLIDILSDPESFILNV